MQLPLQLLFSGEEANAPRFPRIHVATSARSARFPWEAAPQSPAPESPASAASAASPMALASPGKEGQAEAPTAEAGRFDIREPSCP